MCITAQCADPTEVGIWWRDDASWKLYSRGSMRAILQALLKGNTSLQLDLFKSSDLHPQGAGASYLIDLSKMEQTNQRSGHKRAIKLILPNHATYRKDPLGALQGFSVVRFRMCTSNCLLVIHPGNIVEWKVDGEVDAVVNPCSGRVSSQLIGKGESLKSAQTDLEEMPIISSDMKGAVFDNGRSLRSIQNSSGKIVPMKDQTEQAHGSVAAALHQAAGPKLEAALQKSVHFASGKGRCGDAVITPGFKLPASHVVHTFAPPVYRKHDEVSSIAKLEKTYKSALSLAALNGIRYIAFPAISCGAGGFPLQLAARVALEATSCNSSGMLEIHFVLLGQKVLLEWVAQAGESFSRV